MSLKWLNSNFQVVLTFFDNFNFEPLYFVKMCTVLGMYVLVQFSKANHKQYLQTQLLSGGPRLISQFMATNFGTLKVS